MGKRKGAEFEREVCKKLSLWISNGLREDLLWRSAMSGGRSTVARSKGKDLAAQAGDISSVDPLSSKFIKNFFVECKHVRSLDLYGLLTDTGEFIKFWSVAQFQADQHGKEPLLIAKQNRFPTIIGFKQVVNPAVTMPIDPLVFVHRYDLAIYNFDEFLEKAVLW